MSQELRTARLSLRPVTLDDAPGLLTLFGRPEVARWSGDGTVVETMEQAHEKAERYVRRGGGRPGLGVFGIRPRDAAETDLVGVALLVPLPASPHPERTSPERTSTEQSDVERDDIEIGWHLHPDVWGRGYATEAGAAMVTRAWALGLREVHAETRPDNAASQAVCGRLGMEDLGLRDDWYDTTLRAFRLQRGHSEA